MNILLSEQAAASVRDELATLLSGETYRIVTPESAGATADIAFISRDVTGGSTKTQVEPTLQRFYDCLRASRQLQWVHTHSAGADRPIFPELSARGVRVTTSSGANSAIVAHSTLGGLLALARRFDVLAAAQRRHEWRPLLKDAPADLRGQTALIVGYGPIGQRICRLVEALEMKAIAVRRQAGGPNQISFDELDAALPRVNWLILACPLTSRTHGLIDARRLALLPPGACLLNVARGEVVDEAALIAALTQRHLAGAYLDVFNTEPLVTDSPLWDLPGVMVSPHTAGHSSGNYAAVARLWLENVARWRRGDTLLNDTASFAEPATGQ